MPKKEYTLILNSSRESVNMLESFLDEVITEEFEPLYGNIYMAVSETLSNAIIHGNKEDAAKRVVLSCIASAQQLRFTIQDEGKGFDHEHYNDPTVPDNTLKSSGRGIFITRCFCDEVAYEKNGATAILTFTRK